MLRGLTICALLAFAPAAVLATTPAGAQQPAQQPAQQCTDTAAKRAKRSMFGSILGSVAGSVLGSAGAAGSVVTAALPVGTLLTDELLKLLDCKEQQQAARATDQAMRGGVGTEVAWKSESRANVTGRSTVTGEQKLADGGTCLTVTDVVIVDGEETMVPKKMCRAKGASAFARA